ncbi:hypothetical protein B0H19DRAFT_1142984 [Mycena capillaripes]|nr:hypothetical protein B0H19DRAFT_1142984 [Mycena capillaripes]
MSGPEALFTTYSPRRRRVSSGQLSRSNGNDNFGLSLTHALRVVPSPSAQLQKKRACSATPGQSEISAGISVKYR